MTKLLITIWGILIYAGMQLALSQYMEFKQLELTEHVLLKRLEIIMENCYHGGKYVQESNTINCYAEPSEAQDKGVTNESIITT